MNLEKSAWMDIWRLFLGKASIPSQQSSMTTGFVPDISCLVNLQTFMKLTSQPDWLPTLRLGHTKQSFQAAVSVERYERLTERHRRRELLEELTKEALVIVLQLTDEVVDDNSKVIAIEELIIRMEYIKSDVQNHFKCDCASKVESLQKEWLVISLLWNN